MAARSTGAAPPVLASPAAPPGTRREHGPARTAGIPDRKRPQRAVLEAGHQLAQDRRRGHAVQRQRVDPDIGQLRPIEREDVERHRPLDGGDEDLPPADCHRLVGRLEIRAAHRVVGDVRAPAAGLALDDLGNILARRVDHADRAARMSDEVLLGPLDPEHPCARAWSRSASPPDRPCRCRPAPAPRRPPPVARRGADLPTPSRTAPRAPRPRPAKSGRLAHHRLAPQHEKLGVAAIPPNAELAAGTPDLLAPQLVRPGHHDPGPVAARRARPYRMRHRPQRRLHIRRVDPGASHLDDHFVSARRRRRSRRARVSSRSCSMSGAAWCTRKRFMPTSYRCRPPSTWITDPVE